MKEDFQLQHHWHNESTLYRNRDFLVQWNQKDNKVGKENLAMMLEPELEEVETNHHMIDRLLGLPNYSIEICYQKVIRFHNLDDRNLELHFDSINIAYSH